MNTSIYPNSSLHRSVRKDIVGYFLSEGIEKGGSKKLQDKTVTVIDRIRKKGVKNTHIFETMDGEMNAAQNIKTFGDMLGKILSGGSIGKEERRKIRIYVMRQVAHRTHDHIVNTPVLHPIMDYFQQQALHLVEKGIVPAFHNLDTCDIPIPDFHGIPGSIEHLHIPIKYGRLYGYVPSEGRNGKFSRYAYTDKWVLDEHGNPLFELDPKVREGFSHTSSGYLGDGLFLIFHDPGNYDYTWRVRTKEGQNIETFKSSIVQNLGHNLLFPSDDHGNTELGLYDFKKKKWILKGAYHLHMTHGQPEKVILQSKESSKYGVYNLAEKSWSIPCEKNRLIPIQGLKGTTYLTQDDTGALVILDPLGAELRRFSMDTMKQLGFMVEYSDSEKFRYLIGFSHDGNAYFVEELYILSSTGEVSAGPFHGNVWDRSGRVIFTNKENPDTYNRIDIKTGEIQEIKIPGRLILTQEKTYVSYIVFEENGKFGIKNMRGEIVVLPQEHQIVSYFPTSGNLLISRKVPTEEFPLTHERCPEEYQYIAQNGKVILPWSTDLSRMEYVDDNAQFSCYAGKLVYTKLSGKRVIRDIPSGWVTLKPTSEQGIYTVEEDWDRGGIRSSLYNAESNAVYFYGRWKKLKKGDNRFSFSGADTLQKLDNGNFILDNGVVSAKGEQIIPHGSEKITSYRDDTGKEVGVICQYRNSLMKVTWHTQESCVSN